MYEHAGLDAERGAPSKGLSARDFAAADVVLTTYETLQKDVNRQGNITTYALRQAKKYEVRSALLLLVFPSQSRAVSPAVVP